VRWVGSGVASAPRRAASSLRRDGSDSGPAAAAPATSAGTAAAPQQERRASPFRWTREHPGAAALGAAGGVLIAAWIAWTVYIWTENGASAGIGVLITWPAVFAALALVTSPLWATGLLMRRRRMAGEEGAGGGIDEDED
jgi:hypothetical protein